MISLNFVCGAPLADFEFRRHRYPFRNITFHTKNLHEPMYRDGQPKWDPNGTESTWVVLWYTVNSKGTIGKTTMIEQRSHGDAVKMVLDFIRALKFVVPRGPFPSERDIYITFTPKGPNDRGTTFIITQLIHQTNWNEPHSRDVEGG